MTDIIYRKDNSNFILSMNGLNIFTTLFIYYKKGFLSCVPPMGLFVFLLIVFGVHPEIIILCI